MHTRKVVHVFSHGPGLDLIYDFCTGQSVDTRFEIHDECFIILLIFSKLDHHRLRELVVAHIRHDLVVTHAISGLRWTCTWVWA